MPLPHNFFIRCHFIDITAQLFLDTSPFSKRPPGRNLDIFNLFLEFFGQRFVRKEQPVIVGQPPHVIHRTDALMGPHDVAVPIIFDDGFIRSGIKQMSIGQKSASFIKIGFDLPCVDHSPIHIDNPDITGDLTFGSDFG